MTFIQRHLGRSLFNPTPTSCTPQLRLYDSDDRQDRGNRLSTQRRPWRAASIVAISILACLSLLPSMSSACQFLPSAPAGFIHATDRTLAGVGGQHLPANAQGVIFWRNGPPVYQLSNASVKNAYFVVQRPARLMASDFSVIEQPEGRHLPATVTPIDPDEQSARRHLRYFMVTGRSLSQCVRKNLYSMDGCKTLERHARKLVTGGALPEITAAMHQAYGLFLIAPRGGFVPGHRYEIRYTVGTPTSMQWAYPRGIDVTIDTLPVTSWKSHTPRLVISHKPRDIRPDEQDATYVSYELASDLQPYRNSMYFLTMIHVRRSGMMPPPPPPPPICGLSDPLGTPPGTTDLRFADGFCREVAGRVAFLEISEAFAEAAPIRVNCPAP